MSAVYEKGRQASTRTFKQLPKMYGLDLIIFAVSIVDQNKPK